MNYAWLIAMLCAAAAPLSIIGASARDIEIVAPVDPRDECSDPILEFLAPSSFSASSSWPGLTPEQAKMSFTGGNSWAVLHPQDKAPYIQFTFSPRRRITKVATAGRSAANQFVRTYKLSWSSDGANFRDYAVNGETVIFQGNIETFSVQKNKLAVPLSGVRALRLHPLTFTNHPSTRVEVFGC